MNSSQGTGTSIEGPLVNRRDIDFLPDFGDRLKLVRSTKGATKAPR